MTAAARSSGGFASERPRGAGRGPVPVTGAMEALTATAVRRLAMARAGLLKAGWSGLDLATGRGEGRARAGARRVVARFGYLQLDSVAVAGARSHGLVLLARLDRFPAPLAEELLGPGEPLFEYWGHEASWIPLALYPAFAFRRRELHVHPWWGDLLGRHPEVADRLLARVAADGPLRSVDLDGQRRGGRAGWWDLGVEAKVATALWSRGDLAVRERRGFQRVWDLTERVIPAPLRAVDLDDRAGLCALVLAALAGQGWATTGGVIATFRLQRHRTAVEGILADLAAAGLVVPCAMVRDHGGRTAGWARPDDLELADRLLTCRPRPDRGVLLSPFDPLVWDRGRVGALFDFNQVLEIYKPAPARQWGYYCLPVLAGDRLVGRVDLRADRRSGRLQVLARHLEASAPPGPAAAATASAIARLAGQLGLAVAGGEA